MSNSFLSPIVAGLLLTQPLLPTGAAFAEDLSPTYVMTIGTETELGKVVVKSGAKRVFLTCPGGKEYDVDDSKLHQSPKPCPKPDGQYGVFAGRLLDFDAKAGSFQIITRDGQTKSLATTPWMLKDFTKGQDLWVGIDKSPLSTPYAVERME
jgi:hypothetical protein